MESLDDDDLRGGVGLALRWAFIDEVAEGDAPSSIELFEISPENYMGRGGAVVDALARVTARHRTQTHGLSLNIGSTDALDHVYLARLREFLESLGVRSHSDHLCWNGTGGQILHDLLPLPATRAAVTHVADRVRRVQDALGVPLVLENISYYLLPEAEMPEHEFVARVLEAADCRMLLDVNNVWVNAQNHGFDPYEYLRALPLERVDRMHVAGGERSARHGLVIDTHGTDVDAPVRELMAWVLERVGPVPVIYERDHDIPPLAELGHQVAELRAVYDAAIERHRVAQPSLHVARAPQVLGYRDSARIAAFARGLSRVVLDREATTDRLAPRLSSHGLPPTVVGAITRHEPLRLDVYRSLVRAGLRTPILAALPRTAARRGSAAFDEDIARWLCVAGPRSPYLRDVPVEIATWLADRYRDDPSAPRWLADLVAHECTTWELGMLPSKPRAASTPELSLEARIDLAPAVRLVRYDTAVHRLSDDATDPARPLAEPTAEPTRLAAYRDDANEIRWLELTELGYEVLVRLQRGDSLGAAVLAAAPAAGEQIGDELLSRIATLLADLWTRGVIVGTRAQTDHGQRCAS